MAIKIYHNLSLSIAMVIVSLNVCLYCFLFLGDSSTTNNECQSIIIHGDMIEDIDISCVNNAVCSDITISLSAQYIQQSLNINCTHSSSCDSIDISINTSVSNFITDITYDCPDDDIICVGSQMECNDGSSTDSCTVSYVQTEYECIGTDTLSCLISNLISILSSTNVPSNIPSYVPTIVQPTTMSPSFPTVSPSAVTPSPTTMSPSSAMNASLLTREDYSRFLSVLYIFCIYLYVYDSCVHRI